MTAAKARDLPTYPTLGGMTVTLIAVCIILHGIIETRPSERREASAAFACRIAARPTPHRVALVAMSAPSLSMTTAEFSEESEEKLATHGSASFAFDTFTPTFIRVNGS